MTWHKSYPYCIECSSADNKYMAKGLCNKCYLKKYREDPGNWNRIKERKEKWRTDNYEYVQKLSKERRERVHFDSKREEALEKDGRCCSNCGSTEQLVVHHKDENGRGSDEPNNDLTNLSTLCRRCHIEEHREKVSNARRLSVLGKWAHHHSCCSKCGTTERKHAGLGLCVNCYAIHLRTRCKT